MHLVTVNSPIRYDKFRHAHMCENRKRRPTDHPICWADGRSRPNSDEVHSRLWFSGLAVPPPASSLSVGNYSPEVCSLCGETGQQGRQGDESTRPGRLPAVGVEKAGVARWTWSANWPRLRRARDGF